MATTKKISTGVIAVTVISLVGAVLLVNQLMKPKAEKEVVMSTKENKCRFKHKGESEERIQICITGVSDRPY